MLTWETTVEAQALYARGWTKSAIARHLGINRRTVREYLKRWTRPRLGRPAVDPQMPGDRGLGPTSCIQRLRFHSRLPCEHPYGLLRRLGWSETTSVEGAHRHQV